MNANEIKRARRRLSLSQVELAEKLGVHPMTVSRWERGVVAMPEPTARLLALLVDMTGKPTRKRKD